MDIAARLPVRRPHLSRAAKIRLALRLEWKALKTAFAAGAVKGTAKARTGRTKRSRLPLVAAAGAGAAVAAIVGRKRNRASAEIEERHEPAPFPERPPLRPADENGTATATEGDPPVQSLSDG